MKGFCFGLATICSVAGLYAQQASADVSYFREIRPVIQRSCQGCHQPAMKYGALDLTRYESFAAGGSKGPGFKAGAPQESVVLAYLKGERQPRMPFGSPVCLSLETSPPKGFGVFLSTPAIFSAALFATAP